MSLISILAVCLTCVSLILFAAAWDEHKDVKVARNKLHFRTEFRRNSYVYLPVRDDTWALVGAGCAFSVAAGLLWSLV